MRVAWVVVSAVIAGCASSHSTYEAVGETSQPLALSAITPLTTVYVANAGALDVEAQYLPQVVCCENGAAPKGALEAQAVMARTYMYFRNGSDGLGTQAKPFQGTQADQAYHCTTSLSQACKDAVAATHDLVMAYTNDKGTLIANASFFVDGPRPACLANKACSCAQPAATVSMSPSDHEPSCDCFTFSSQGLANPAYVTYNWSHTGSDVNATTLGSTSNESNRGCASQNIQACLAYAGWSYLDQLRFFYGQDIALYHPDGTAAGGADGGAPPPADPGGDGGGSFLGSSGNKSDGDSPGCAAAPRGEPMPLLLLLSAASTAALRRRRRAGARA